MKYLRKLISTSVLIGAFVSPAIAQSDTPTAESDPVLVFNRVCYAQVPVVRNIQDMAGRLAWEQMGGDDLKQFTTVDNPDLLQGWDVRIAQRLYRLGVVQSDLTEKFKESFPDFTRGHATSCTLILDGNDEADIVLQRMTSLARKEPVSKDVPDGNLLTSTWAGGNEDFKVFLFYKSDANGKANMLNVTILSKEKLKS